MGDDTIAKAPTQRRGRSAGDRPTRPRPEWQWAKVVDVIAETPETATLKLACPVPTEYLPGQYYNIRHPVPGRPRPIQRAYSIGSSPHPDPSVIEVTVKEMEGGLISPRLVREVRPGDEMEVRGPYGTFTWTVDEPGPLLFVAAGSGVVPFMAMIRYAVAHGATERMRLLFSSKSADTVIYADELARLEAEHSWLDVVHSFTRSPEDPRSRHHRRIDEEMVLESLREVADDPASVRGFACGPPEMVTLAEEVMLKAGMDREKVKTEKYD